MPIKSAPVQDPEDVYQRTNKAAMDALLALPILQGTLVEDVDVGATAVRVNHNLGRPARGFLVTKATEDVRVWLDDTTPASALFLPLIASGSATVSLWVF